MTYTIKEYNGKYSQYEVTGKCEKLFQKYNSIKDVRDLKRNKLTLAEYHTIPYLLHDLAQHGKTATCTKNISEWFKKQGCTIQPDEYGINYCIRI